MIQRSLSLAAALAVFVFASPTGHADVLSLHASVFGGGSTGKGISGQALESTDPTMPGTIAERAFHRGAQGGAYGAQVGVEFMFFDGWVEHTQLRGSDGLLGTWTQFMAGLDLNLDLGERPRVATEEGGTKFTGHAPAYIELGLAIGFGVGTGQQVDPPLDRSEVVDRGFLAQVNGEIGYRLTKVLSIGLRVPVQFGWMFKPGFANDETKQYQSIQAAALLQMRVDFRLK